MASRIPPAVSGTRRSQKREALSEILLDTTVFRSAQDIHVELRNQGHGIGLSTVYRQLQQMADQELVDTLRNEDGEVLYRRCSPKHHHHLVCRACGRVEEVKGPTVETWAEKAASQHGFVDVSHQLEIFGVCPACR